MSRTSRGQASQGMTARGGYPCRSAPARAAAHDGLYCQRTHFSPPEQRKWKRRDPHERAMDAVPPVADYGNLLARIKRLMDTTTIRLMQKTEMTGRWRAGEFDHLYGPYAPKGVLMKAPPKIYVERSERDGA